MTISPTLYSSKTSEWATPQAFFDKLDAEFHFTLDPCATPENAKCKMYFTADDDGLSRPWYGHRVFCNPPYGKQLPRWIEKCHDEALYNGVLVVMLIPARTDTKAWHKWIFPAAEVCFVKGRLKFGGAKGSAPFPSAVIVFRGWRNENFYLSKSGYKTYQKEGRRAELIDSLKEN